MRVICFEFPFECSFQNTTRQVLEEGGGEGSLVVNMFCIRLLHIFLFLQKCVSLVTFALLCVAMQNTLMQGLDGGMG